jgi:hypothetical protein
VKSNLPKVFELILFYDWANSEAPELRRWKAMLGEKLHAYVGGEIEVRAVRQVTVKIHRSPPRKKLLRVRGADLSGHEPITRHGTGDSSVGQKPSYTD